MYVPSNHHINIYYILLDTFDPLTHIYLAVIMTLSLRVEKLNIKVCFSMKYYSKIFIVQFMMTMTAYLPTAEEGSCYICLVDIYRF